MTDLSRPELDAKLSASEAKVDARLANFDTSIKDALAELRAEFQALRAEFHGLRAEMHKNAADLLKWGAGIAFAAVASTVGLLTYLNKASEKPAAPPQVPIIIFVPSAPQVPSGTPQTAPQPGR